MIKIRNWDSFQHYKNRNPPWIRLYARLLDDPELYELSDRAARILPLLWLIASRHNTDGSLPAIKTLAFQLRIASNELAEVLIELKQWVMYDASDMLADCLQHAIPEQSRVEQRQSISETETETPKPPKGADASFEKFWNAYDNKVGKGAAVKAFNNARKRDLPPIDTLVAIIAEQKAQRAKLKASGAFVPEWPNPSTWLNQDRWTDEIKEPEQIETEEQRSLREFMEGARTERTESRSR